MSLVEQKQNKLIGLRQKYYASINATHDLLPFLDDTQKLQEFCARMGRIEAIYDSFEKIQNDLIGINVTLPSEQQVDVLGSSKACDELYYRVLAKYAEVKDRLKPPAVISAPPEAKPRIPKINIEPFSGQIEKFPSFKSLYDTLIHNTTLSSIEKYSYLLTLLQGKALNVIKTIEFNESNYLNAYTKLCEEYSNPRLVATHYLNKLLNCKSIPTESPTGLRLFLDHFHVDAQALIDLGIPDLSDFILLSLALKTLPVETRRLFENEFIKKRMPSLKDLVSYVKDRLSILEISSSGSKTTIPVASRSLMVTSDVKPIHVQKSSGVFCPLCKGPHRIHQCSEFLSITVSQRQDFVKSSNLCYACLGPHRRADCRSSYSCRTCKDKGHHSLLHPSSHPSRSQGPVETVPSKSKADFDKKSFAASQHHSTVLLGTAMAQVQCASGLWHNVRILVDPGSMGDFVSRSLAQTLKIEQTPGNFQITGLGHTPIETAKFSINLKIAPKGLHHEPILQVNATVIPTISMDIPSAPIPAEIAAKFENVNLADYSIFKKSSKVDILLGAAHLGNILLSDQPIIPGKPSCMPTIFGHMLIGEIPNRETTAIHAFFTQSTLEDQIKRFWEMEEVSCGKPLMSPEEERCEEHFIRTHSRCESGQFVVRLPFREDLPPDLGSTREVALRQFHTMERRMQRDEQFKQLYHNDIKDYLSQDQLAVAPQPSSYVLPHHAVLKSSVSHPLRIVFNASQLSDKSKSLNDSLLVGPKLQNDVGDIILMFRLHAIPLCADIRQMYRAILIHPLDRKYQHIFWRFGSEEPVTEYELKRLTFGFTPASYLAQKCLQTLAKSEMEKYPNACQVILGNCYVDDIVTGANTIEETCHLRNELVNLLDSGGFELRKFSSSVPDVLLDVPKSLQDEVLSLDNVETLKVLGLQWSPAEDIFCYTIAPKTDGATKRILLSNVASIYDINGYLTHLVVYVKILIQQLWLSKSDWDDPLPTHLLKKWKTFVDELPQIKTLKIPRYISSLSSSAYQLIGFADASNNAMAAIFYLRVLSGSGTLVNLVRAKSKVAPLKVISIPRLELCAAHLLVRLFQSLQVFINKLAISEVYCFTDSTTVLSWIQTPPHQLKTFVANRVAEIIERLPASYWRYVPTANNPADLATRGLLPSQVIEHYDFWFHGPKFLSDDIDSWPKTPQITVTNVPELKPKMTLVSQQNNLPLPEVLEYFLQFSSLIRLQRVFAWILRFKNNCRSPKGQRQYGTLNSSELDRSLRTCAQLTQGYYYLHELKTLKDEKLDSGPLRTLSPFIDSSGLLMVGGRLRNSPLSVASKHPILLPAKSHLATLLVDYFHIYSLHGNGRIVQSLLQRQFWIVGSRNLIKKRIFSCLKCYKLTAAARTPIMGDIPSSRFAQGRCFVNTAIDYAGPFMLKDGSRRNAPKVKCYMVVFVCMSVKAIHLELATALTMESCLAALDRFIARRGKPDNMYSDQGTNFKAAARHINEVESHLKSISNHINDHLSRQGINWHFQPPGAPNFSGLVEAGVKSAKYHLKRILEERALNYEEFSTLLCQVEAVLNSRPLGVISTVPDDGYDCLTPGHFLIGAPLLARPEHDMTQNRNLLCRWKMLSKVTQVFWKRWLAEYLHTQIQRPKWHKDYPNLKVNDVVLVTGENTSPLQWPLARVTKVFPGKDSVVRVAEVKLSNGFLTRPVSKLLPLPFTQ